MSAGPPPRCWESLHRADDRLGMHRHGHAYAALVLEGCYDERSVDGRFSCDAGTLVIHPPYHAHANAFGGRGARVVNVTLPPDVRAEEYRVVIPRDPSSIERMMRIDPIEGAVAAGAEPQRIGALSTAGWLSRLACMLRARPVDGHDTPIAELAARVGRSHAHATRAFTEHFGMGPAVYRREFRLRLAASLVQSGVPLRDAAVEAGFADQSHFGRELKRATGFTPGQWRLRARPAHSASNPF